MEDVLKRITFGTAICKSTLTDTISSEEKPDLSFKKENIVIIGGELFNKGAQAMTFTVVDQLQRRFPEKSIYLFSEKDYYRDESDKEQYGFKILPWTVNTRTNAMSPILPTPSKVSKSVKDEVLSVLKDCAFIIDINGYALSSQWGVNRSMLYMANIAAAKNFSIPIYIFPQSIGPFDYQVPAKYLLDPLFRTYLPFPELICPREREGKDWLGKYTNSNVDHQFDIVLQYKGYDLDNIYSKIPEFREPVINENAIGIIPNSQVEKRIESEKLYKLYSELIKSLLNNGNEVYVLRHSVEDLELCNRIVQRAENSDDVHLLNSDFSAIELEHIIEQFQFIIGSRYHSIVHAYKNNTPVIAIGWATKYESLLDKFDQSQYFFEGRNKVTASELINAAERLSKNMMREKRVIENTRGEILENDIITENFS
ncbi:polysaccharide pyruvyl transferase family protein [Natronosalvus vescus]|uniref:polysaccharide pyruvyl transferase family protein n=1 Tax=Natronosalvus vescus TaxID=2953881 RepID=UPI0020911A66|nr:polysaccharide pyruvyl transferase family protein [Natronosalvus vescus]